MRTVLLVVLTLLAFSCVCFAIDDSSRATAPEYTDTVQPNVTSKIADSCVETLYVDDCYVYITRDNEVLKFDKMTLQFLCATKTSTTVETTETKPTNNAEKSVK